MTTLSEITNPSDVQIVEKLARVILPEACHGIIPDDHILYLLGLSYNYDKMIEQVSEKKLYFYLISVNEIPVGFFSIDMKEKAIVLDKLYILSAYRNQNLGTEVILFMEEKRKELKLSSLEVLVHQQNTRAITFYERHGFVKQKEVHHTFENGHSLQGYYMVKELRI